MLDKAYDHLATSWFKDTKVINKPIKEFTIEYEWLVHIQMNYRHQNGVIEYIYIYIYIYKASG
jgi:hypothetical protein